MRTRAGSCKYASREVTGDRGSLMLASFLRESWTYSPGALTPIGFGAASHGGRSPGAPALHTQAVAKHITRDGADRRHGPLARRTVQHRSGVSHEANLGTSP